MIHGGLGGGRRTSVLDPPIELRFVDLFMIIVTLLMFITVILSVISAFVGGVNVDVAPKVLTKTAPTALTNESYELTLAATGGSGLYLWNIAGGQLPDGLRLTKEGMLVGIPTQVQKTQFTVRVTDSQNRSDTSAIEFKVDTKGENKTVTVSSIHVLAPNVLQLDATSSQPYRIELSAEGGTPPYNWRLVQGQLPDGLNLFPEGMIAGTPINWDSNPHTFTIAVSDAIGHKNMQQLEIFVNPPPPQLWQIVIEKAIKVIAGLGFLLIVINMLVRIKYKVVLMEKEKKRHH